jgi:hypothetical protein
MLYLIMMILYHRKETRKKIRKRKKKLIKKTRRIKPKKIINRHRLKKIWFQTLSLVASQKMKMNQLRSDFFID